MIKPFVAGVALLVSTALPHQASPAGYGVEEHLVQSGGRTYVEAVAHAPRSMHIAFNLTADDRYYWDTYHGCQHATTCHYRYELHTCPNQLDVWIGDNPWYLPYALKRWEDVFSVCGSH